MSRDLKAVLEIAIKAVGTDRLAKIAVVLDKVSGSVKKLDVAMHKAGPAGTAAFSKTGAAAQKLAAALAVAQARAGKYNAEANKANVGANKLAHALAAAGAAGASNAAKAAMQQQLLAQRLAQSAAQTGKLIAQTNKLNTAQRGAPRQGGGFFGSKPGRVSGVVTGIQNTATVLGGAYYAGRAIAGAAGAVMNPAIEMESRLAEIQVKGRYSDADTAKLGAAARKIGDSSMFSPLQAVETQLAMAGAGLKADQVIATMPVVKKFAVANGLGSDEASKALIALNRQFGNEVTPETMASMADYATAAANASIIEMPALLQSMSYVGTIGHVAGYTPADMMALVATMGEAGIEGSMSGTGGRNLLSAMAKPMGGRRTEKYLKRLGLTTKQMLQYASPESGLGGVPAWMELLNERENKAGFSKADRMGLSAAMYGKYGMTAQLAVEGAAATYTRDPEHKISDMRMMQLEVANGKGLTEEAYKIRMATAQARLNEVSARWETLMLDLGTIALPLAVQGLQLLVARLHGLIEIVNFFTGKPDSRGTRSQQAAAYQNEQRRHAGDINNIPVFGPGQAAGATVGERDPAPAWRAFLNTLGAGDITGKDSGQKSLIEVTVKAESGTTAKITKVDKGKTPLRAATTAAP
jgi:TP901 family phage tail tape measure protein